MNSVFDPLAESLTSAKKLFEKAKGVYVNLPEKFATLESGRRVYMSDVILRASNDYEELLRADQASILPCETLADGCRHFLMDINAPGIYAVGDAPLLKTILAAGCSADTDEVITRRIASMLLYTGRAALSRGCLELVTQTRRVRKPYGQRVTIAVFGNLADMSDVRDLVRHANYLITSCSSFEIVGDSDLIAALERDPNLAADEKGVLRYVTRKAPPGGYAPNPKKPAVDRAYTVSLTGDSTVIFNAIADAMRKACSEELASMPSDLYLRKDEKDLSWLRSYARIVLWNRGLRVLPKALRDPVTLLLSVVGYGCYGRVAGLVATNVLYLAPEVRKGLEGGPRQFLGIILSMLWRLLHVPKYANWRRQHADFLAKKGLPATAAATVLAREVCMRKEMAALTTDGIADRLVQDIYLDPFDLAQVKLDIRAFLAAFAPKSVLARQT